MKVSIITATYNSAKTVKDTIESVIGQTYKNIEYIIIDGASKDNTLEIVNEYSNNIAKVISEKDNGIYDAMNKGIKIASGDIIGILNSDDFFSDNNIVAEIVNAFSDKKIDAVYGDIHYVDDEDLKKCVRYYSSKIFRPYLMRFGFMPAHPSFYVKKKCYEKYGNFKMDYKIGADFELLLRFIFVNKINIKYLDLDFVTMRTGGISTSGISSHKQIMKDHLLAFESNQLYTNKLLLSIRYIYKIIELIWSKFDNK